jgi:hypothetical protein
VMKFDVVQESFAAGPIWPAAKHLAGILHLLLFLPASFRFLMITINK